MERLLWWVLAGSRGGASRARIMAALRQRPYNANQLAEKLDMAYKTVRHHLQVLEKNVVVVSQGERYAKLYYLSKNMDGYYSLFEQICQKLGLQETGSDTPAPPRAIAPSGSGSASDTRNSPVAPPALTSASNLSNSDSKEDKDV